MTSRILILACTVICFGASPGHEALEKIQASSLRGNLSFLASDALEGRGTPSRGLDLAAEFIASRFRAAGLTPIFQTAKFAAVTSHLDDFRMTLTTSGGTLELKAEDVRVRSLKGVDLNEEPVLELPENGAIPPVEGKVVAGESKRYGGEAMLILLQSRHPSAILLFSKNRGRPQANATLQDTQSGDSPVFRIGNEEGLASLLARRDMKVTVHLSAPVLKAADLNNVAAILPGSDPALKNQFIVVSAHYDHLGMKEAAEGDRIYNGANDDGSGTVSVIEIANALASMAVRPRRSILFIAYFGEEEGLLGSFYYAKHPLAPLKDTIANINLEQMGRTDEAGGKEEAAFGFTGSAFSEVPAIMSAAAAREGVRTYTRKGADSYFARSDNYALALGGVIAHTIVVAFDYPDYHAVGDKWPKIDYENMAKVDRGVTAGILQLANSDTAPAWSDSKEAAPYREAGR